MESSILIIGATSAIATACARKWAATGCKLYLMGRSAERLAQLAEDLRIRGAGAVWFESLDVNDTDRHEGLIQQADEQLGGIDTALIAHGTLPDQQDCQRSVAITVDEFNTNAVSTIALMTVLANRFETRGRGSIAVIGSVAGERGRQSNYVYGSAKAAVETFTQGLRNRLYSAGVNVLLIKPGFVDTPMTADFDKGLLWVKPEYVAGDIVTAIERGKSVIYTPWFWRWIMLIIRSIPERLFVRLKL